MVLLGLSLSLIVCATSCQLLNIILDGKEDEKSTGNGFLQALPLSPDSVVVDVYKIRVPHDKRELVQALWQKSDRLDMPVETERKLYDQGLRVGRLGSHVPVELSRLLELRDQPIVSPIAEKKRDVADEQVFPQLTTRHSPVIRNGVPVAIETCDPKERLSLFAMVDGEALGQTYHKAFGVIQLHCKEENDGSVKITAIPEIHYGDIHSRPVSQNGVKYIENTRNKISMDHLKIDVKLLLGQWLIIGPTGGQFGVGNRIFVHERGDPEQRLLAIRLVRTQKDGIHDRNDIATLDWVPEQKEDSHDQEDEPISIEKIKAMESERGLPENR